MIVTEVYGQTAPKVSMQVESSSRPGLFHDVTLAPDSCSCEATVSICRHIRQARIRVAKASGPCCCLGGWVYVGFFDEDDTERVASYRCRRCA